MNPDVSIAAIDALLPQTQCTKCGYPSCLDYAREIFEGTSDINRCPPGGAHSINALADLVDMPPKPLDPSCGQSGGWVYARINEAECIGCTLCIAACPVDAIVGSGKLMHTIIQDECTGCELCLPPCPVDCITLSPCAPFEGPTPWPDLAPDKVDRARRRVANRKERLSAPVTDAVSTVLATLDGRRAEIESSVKRRRKQRQRADSSSSQ